MDRHLQRTAGACLCESKVPRWMLPAVLDLGTPRSDENEAQKIRRKMRQHELRQNELRKEDL